MEHNSIFDKQFGEAVADGQINSIAEAREYAAGWWRNLLAMKSETCEDWKVEYDRLSRENAQNAALAKAYADEAKWLRKLFVGAIDERNALQMEIDKCAQGFWGRMAAKNGQERDALKLENAELAEALTRIADGFDGYNSEDWQIIAKENRQVAKDALSSHHAKGPINH